MILATIIIHQSLYIDYITATLCGKPHYHHWEKWDLDMETQNGRMSLTCLALKPIISPTNILSPSFLTCPLKSHDLHLVASEVFQISKPGEENRKVFKEKTPFFLCDMQNSEE